MEFLVILKLLYQDFAIKFADDRLSLMHNSQLM